MQPELHGLVPVEQGSYTGLHSMAMGWPDRLKQALAVCNSLTLIGRNQLVGDDADKQAFKAVEARFLVSQDWLGANSSKTFVLQAVKGRCSSRHSSHGC